LPDPSYKAGAADFLSKRYGVSLADPSSVSGVFTGLRPSLRHVIAGVEAWDRGETAVSIKARGKGLDPADPTNFVLKRASISGASRSAQTVR